MRLLLSVFVLIILGAIILSGGEFILKLLEESKKWSQEVRYIVGFLLLVGLNGVFDLILGIGGSDKKSENEDLIFQKTDPFGKSYKELVSGGADPFSRKNQKAIYKN